MIGNLVITYLLTGAAGVLGGLKAAEKRRRSASGGGTAWTGRRPSPSHHPASEFDSFSRRRAL
jgi:hypothetical protein